MRLLLRAASASLVVLSLVALHFPEIIEEGHNVEHASHAFMLMAILLWLVGSDTK